MLPIAGLKGGLGFFIQRTEGSVRVGTGHGGVRKKKGDGR